MNDSRDDFPNFYKQVQSQQENCIDTGHKKGIFDTYLGSDSMLSPNIQTDSHLADEFLGLCQTDAQQEKVTESFDYT